MTNLSKKPAIFILVSKWGEGVILMCMESKPFFSIVLLVHKGTHFLSSTLDTLNSQNEKNFEILLMDKEGAGRLQEIVARYPELRFSYHRTGAKNESEMMNEGIQAAKGKYLQFLHPGDRFISQYSLAHLRELIEQEKEPHLAYGGFLSQGIDQPPQALSRPVDLESLKKGIFPDATRATWFLKKSIVDLGGFNSQFFYHSTFDLLCRLFKNQQPRTACSKRILTDSEPRKKTSREFLGSVVETFQILYGQFGLWSALRWIFAQDLNKLARSGLRYIKHAFTQDV